MSDELINLLSKQTEILEGLAAKSAGNAQSVAPLHGNGGVFSSSMERDVISAVVTPYGISAVLPAFPSVNENPLFGAITGFTDVVGSEPTTPCADAPVGYIKGANLTAKFGMTRRDTNTVDIAKVMMKKNRGDFTDLVMRGKIIGTELLPASIDDNDVLNIIVKSEMVGAAAQAQRKLSKDIWRGTVASGTFPGLDVQVATGQKDAETGTLAPALDSDVKDFNFDLIGGTGRDIVEYISMVEFYCRYNAENMGLDPVRWVVAMRPELWQELTAVWPLAYNTLKANSKVTVDGVELTRERDRMRNAKRLIVNGNEYEVVLDTGIYEYNSTNSAGLAKAEYASGIYFLPMTINGNFPVLYREFVDYRAMDTLSGKYLNGLNTFWSDGGEFSWAVETNKWCIKLSLRADNRIILRTPQLAGKIQKVKYVPLQHLREPYPESSYFADGGVSMRSSTTFNSVW